MKTCERVEWRPVSIPSRNGELAESASRSGRNVRSALQTRTARSGPLIADVDVDPEAVVLPDDVAEQLVVAAVVRRVDDPLLLPRAPRVRARGAERDPEPVGERGELGAPLADRLRRLGEALAEAGLHLDLRGDQLADEVRLEVGALGRRLDVFEAVHQRERAGVEQGELLLDRDREVARGLELLACEAELLFRAEALCVSHGRGKVIPLQAGGGAVRRPSSSSARPRPCAQPRRELAVRKPAATAGGAASTRGRRHRRSRSRRGRECSGGYSRSIPAATSARPECRATTGGTPAAAASAATMPNASGKIEGTTETSASGSRYRR